MSCFQNNEENYISFSRDVVVNKFIGKKGEEVLVRRQLRFIDSFGFMASSLDALANNLCVKRCKELSNVYSGEQLHLLTRKGIYLYDYMDCVDKLSDTTLPPKSAFFPKLNDTHTSDEDYAPAISVWNTFGCKTFRDYHNLYNKSDVFLLVDVLENFRDVCLKNYKLDPAWHYTSPGLAWNAVLKSTKMNWNC